MQLRVTVHDTAGGRAADCAVTAPTGTRLEDVRADLLRRVGLADGRLFCDGEDLAGSAVLGVPPLVDGAVLTTAPTPAAPPADVELRVTAGPDAGDVVPLGPGDHRVGRALTADVSLADPDVSRLHAVVRVGAGAATVADLDSTNGTTVDGRPVGSGAALEPGAVLQVGSTRLAVAAPAPARAACRPDEAGRVQVNRPPRLTAPTQDAVVTLPTPPPPRERTRLPVIALAVPLLAGLVLVAVTRNPMYAAFLLLSPAMVLGTYLSDRVGGGRTARRKKAEYDVALTGARRALAEAVTAESGARHAAHPGPDTLLRCATGPAPRLWERRPFDPDALVVRLGLADLPADVTVVRPSAPLAPGALSEPDADAVPDPVVESVPAVVGLAEVGALGVAGPRTSTLAVARHVVAQLVTWHSPRHLGLVVLAAAGGEDWAWARWLPHLRPQCGEDVDLLVGLGADQVRRRVAELVEMLDARSRARSALADRERPERAVVVVLDAARELRRTPGVARLLAGGPAVGIFCVCLEETAVGLPVECGATAEVVGETSTALRVTVAGAPPVEPVALDGVSAGWAERLARALAPLVDATPDERTGGLPPSARWLDLSPVDVTDPATLAQAWRLSPRCTTVVLGVGPDGSPFGVDLRRDGPHALVAGTTGSGKSELLQTLVAGLAAANRPDEMAYVLVDYKGGAAFQDCARLPHTVGLVTDLDGHLTERALASLTAELRRRETLLRAAGCSDVDEYLALPDAGPQPLPRLVIVVDEFATLAEELPDFVGGLVGIAQRGRSLGVHLVLATQRPSGVVSADIRANTTLRIALRVTDAAESVDVVDVADAAAIARTSPGRAVARIGTGPVTSFQCARVGVPATTSTCDVRVLPFSWSRAGDPAAPPDVEHAEQTDLAMLVDAARDAAAALGVTRVASPWLPPLESRVTVAQLPPTGEPTDLPYGVVDLPHEQRRAPLVLDLEHGDHLLVVGGPRSGRSTLVRTLAGVLVTRLAPSDAHLYVLDGSGSLSDLAALPHCGAVVARDEVARGDRLLSRLAEEVARRQAYLSAAGFASVAEQRGASSPEDRLPMLLLAVDGWEAVQTAYDEVDHGRPLDTLVRLVREGASAGLRVVLTGDRGLLTSRVGASAGDRLLLRLADPADYGLAGIPSRNLPATLPPGRAIRAADGAEVQVALLDQDPAGRAQQAALARIAATTTPPPGSPDVSQASAARDATHQRPFRVEPLPGRVALDSLLAPAKTASTGPLWALVGVGGDELEPVGVDLDADGPAFVVAGPPRSGRSTTLLTMARWLGHEGVPTVAVAHPRSPLSGLASAPGVRAVVRADEADRLVGALAGGPCVVLADDAESLHDMPVERVLTDLLRPDRTAGSALVLAGSAADMAAAFRGVTVEARRNRCGLLLGAAGPVEGDLFGVRVPRSREAVPGRGLLVVRGRTSPVQVAVAADVGARPPVRLVPARTAPAA